MKIMYRAFDGRLFEDESECRSYEEDHKPKHIDKVSFFDDDCNEYHINKDDACDPNVDMDYIYNRAVIVIIYSYDEYKEFIALSYDAGWREFYEQITGPGTWVRIPIDDELMDSKWIYATDYDYVSKIRKIIEKLGLNEKQEEK